MRYHCIAEKGETFLTESINDALEWGKQKVYVLPGGLIDARSRLENGKAATDCSFLMKTIKVMAFLCLCLCMFGFLFAGSDVFTFGIIVCTVLIIT